MSRHQLRPQGDFPPAGLVRRLAAMFYDFLLCMALMMVVTLLYQQGILRLIYGAEQLKALADAGGLDRDPILASLKVVLVDVSQREARKEKEGPEVVAGET